MSRGIVSDRRRSTGSSSHGDVPDGSSSLTSSTFSPTACDVVVVDDDVDIREIIGETLEEAGYRVRSAANGREALAVLDGAISGNDRPCLILLDMMMPEMNGWQFLDRRAKSPELICIPVVVVSASARAPENAQGFLRKPVDLDGLLRTVQKHCPPK